MKICIAIILLWGVFANAESPFEPRLVNYDLKSQLESQADSDGERVLPSTERFSMATDLIMWKYWPDTSSYFHGPGFWLDTFLEYRPMKTVSINSKILFSNGSSSFGYAAFSRMKPFVGVTWTPEFDSKDWGFMFRFFDLDRTTIASGLFFQDREMSGAFMSLRNRNWYLNLRLPGTSVLNISGDLYSLETFFKTSLGDMGLHAFYIADFARLEPIGSGATLDLQLYDIDPVTSLFLRSPSENRGTYKMEVANRGDQWAGLLGVGYALKTQCSFCVEAFLQARQYDQNIVEELGGNASFDFIPYSVHFRDYTNAINILSEPGRAQSASLLLNLKLEISKRFFLESFNEIGAIRYNSAGAGTTEDQFYWYRQSLAFCPYENRPRSCARFFVANKVLLVNNLERSFFTTNNINKRADIFGLEARIFL